MNWLLKEEPTHYSFDDLVRATVSFFITLET